MNRPFGPMDADKLVAEFCVDRVGNCVQGFCAPRHKCSLTKAPPILPKRIRATGRAGNRETNKPTSQEFMVSQFSRITALTMQRSLPFLFSAVIGVAKQPLYLGSYWHGQEREESRHCSTPVIRPSFEADWRPRWRGGEAARVHWEKSEGRRIRRGRTGRRGRGADWRTTRMRRRLKEHRHGL